jgi:hypothetical protein
LPLYEQMSWRNLIFVFLFLAILACENNSNEILDPSASVLLSTDTLKFDTLLNNRQSITKRVRVFNNSGAPLNLSEIGLTGGSGSYYNLTVNGVKQKRHENIRLATNDSLLILLDVLPNTSTPETYQLLEDLLFVRGVGFEVVAVIQSWSLSATFLGKVSLCDQRWQGVQVLSDTLFVPSNCFLEISAGSMVLFDPGAALFVQGQLLANGSFEQPVLFSNSRLDAEYQSSPGQWDAIYFLEGSTNNILRHTTIENGRIGIRAGTPDQDTIPDITLQNVTIRHMSQFGIQAFSTDLLADNILIYDTGLGAAFHAIGGNYSYNHATMTNYPSQINTDDPLVLFADHLLTETGALQESLHVLMTNSIVWGGLAESDLVFSILNPTETRTTIQNNMIYSEEPLIDNLTSSILDFPEFLSPLNFNYRLDSLSPAINSGIITNVTSDLEESFRDTLPDMGAFEYQF